MTEVRIVGIGSPFGDDQIGWAVIETLTESGMLDRFLPGRVDAICCGHEAGLLTQVATVRKAIVIDAMRSSSPVGSVHKIAIEDVLPESSLLSSHRIGIAQAISLGRALSMLPPTLILYGIEIRDTASDEIHPDVRAAIAQVLHAIALDLATLVPDSA